MYILSITGPIGSGKSTLIKSLKQYLSKTYKVITIPEYIDGDPIFGLEMLKRFINGSISSLTFQSYILDYYNNIIKDILKDISSEIVLIEKLPYDSVYCFGSVAVKNKQLTQQEFDVLVNKLELLKLDLPTYKSNLKVLNTDSLSNILNKSIDIINEDLNNGITKRAIYLKCNLEVCKERIMLRNRSGEDNYSPEYLQQIIDFYDTII